MPLIAVDPDVLNSPHVRDYLLRQDRRVLTGLRYTIEALGLPMPDYAARRKPGFTPGRAALAAYRADNPHALPPAALPPRRPNADPATVAAARQRRALPA